MNTGELLSSLNLIYSISHLYFLYKLSFLLHSLLDNGAKMTPKRRSVYSLIFIVICISKFNLIRIFALKMNFPGLGTRLDKLNPRAFFPMEI